MKTIKVPGRDQVSAESQSIFDEIKKKVGKVPNLYATIGYSSHALKGYLAFDDELSHGLFTPKEKEAIFLVVSEINKCNYCLASHTVSSKMLGTSAEEILNNRSGTSSDTRTNIIVQIAQSIAKNNGDAEETLVENFFAAGFDESALIELIGLITVRIFTNYVYAITQIPIDFPRATPLTT